MKVYRIVPFLGFIFLCFNMQAQTPAKQLQAQRVAYITQQMGLTPEEAEKFWPIYNQYAENLKQIRQNYRQTKISDTASDEEIEKFILASFEKDQKEIDLKKDYYLRLKKVTSIRKIQQMYRAEIDFRQDVIKRLKNSSEN